MKKLVQKSVTFVKFAFVGGINTVSSLLIYYLLIYMKIPYMTASVCGYIGSSLIGYVLNRFWVFEKTEEKVRSSIIKYYIVYGSALLLNMGCMYLWVQRLEISKMLAPFLTLCITVPYNYLFSRLWVFPSSEKRKRRENR